MKNYEEFLNELEDLTCEELLQEIRNLWEKETDLRRRHHLESIYWEACEKIGFLTQYMDNIESSIKDIIWQYYDYSNYKENPDKYMKEYEKQKKKEEREEAREMKKMFKHMFR